MVGFSAVGSLREEVKPRDFCVAGGVVDWTKGVSLRYGKQQSLRVSAVRSGYKNYTADRGGDVRFGRGHSSKEEW